MLFFSFSFFVSPICRSSELFPLNLLLKRCFTILNDCGFFSIAIHFLCSSSEATLVVPEPAKGSRTRSPLFVLSLIILSNSLRGFLSRIEDILCLCVFLHVWNVCP